MLGEHGIPTDSARGRREFARRTEQCRLEPEAEVHARIRRGWKLGAEDFLDRLKDRLVEASPESHLPCQVRETMAVKGRRLIVEALKRREWVSRSWPACQKGSSQGAPRAAVAR